MFFPASSMIYVILCFLSTFALGLDLISTGSTIALNGIPYYIPSTPYVKIPNFHSRVLAGKGSGYGGIVPVTVVKATAAVTLTQLSQTITAYGNDDDVWQTGFLSIIFIQSNSSTSGPSYISNGTITIPASNQSSTVSVLNTSTSASIPPGPYFITSEGALYQPWRLYADIAGAFTQPLIPAPGTPGVFSALPATVPGIDSPGVAVPSRLYYTKTAEKPLAGVRTGIKDIYDVAGVKTSDGNRAYYGLYDPRKANAVAVQRLIDAGAILVGKMKTSQFANGETATDDWVDYHSPFNPRGDGYQDPSSSSSGPGAGAGSYPWLDLTLGSDTGGSIRGPSQVQGLYGNRPSHGLVPLTGVMPLAPQLDTAGFLCRDPTIWTAAAKAIYETNITFPGGHPKKLQTIGFPVPGDVDPDPLTAESNVVLLNFLSQLEKFLSVTATALNYTALWDKTKPDPSLPSIPIFLNKTYIELISFEQTMLVRDPFYADYAAAHDGRKPFVDPVPLVRWAVADSLPASDLNVAINNKTIFMNWWDSHVAINATDSCDGIILYSGGVSTNYRNEYIPPPSPPYGYGDGRLSPLTEIPDFVVPLGSAAYNSTITNHTEVLPVTVDILASKGCDGLIFQLAEDLVAAGILKVSQTGRTITGGEILLRRGWGA